ncbi:unnamed protein product [Peronospora destructor]|uniref:endo-polygalacturonase n=1 Tax=Peronospora destructor TaxID=86335 RepID=A0AAV0TKH0_9STRA|nr:unnamed protein product [Peronospora destructor]
MKLFSTALAALSLLVATTNGTLMLRMEAEGKSNPEQQNPMQHKHCYSTSSIECNLTGTYKNDTDISSCTSITVDSLRVPPGVTLDLSKAKKGAIIQFKGTTIFGAQKWAGPLVLLGGTDLTVKGNGVLKDRGSWYWKQGKSITRPVFFRLKNVTSSTVSEITIKNMPFRTFSIQNCTNTTLTGITIDSRAGNGIAKNTDGFGMSLSDHVTITNNTIYNQDDCLAMSSSTNTVFTGNYCCGGNGISIGSIGGNSVNQSTTVQGLLVKGNTVVDSVNGLRIKTIIDLKGLVSDVMYVDNDLINVKNAIVIRSDYSKKQGGYTNTATSQVQITGITVSGLTGSAKNLYAIYTNPSVVSNWNLSHINVTTSAAGLLRFT